MKIIYDIKKEKDVIYLDDVAVGWRKTVVCTYRSSGAWYGLVLIYCNREDYIWVEPESSLMVYICGESKFKTIKDAVLAIVEESKSNGNYAKNLEFNYLNTDEAWKLALSKFSRRS